MHDWVVAAQHKLILFSANGVGKSEAVSYSGPTHNANRSGKHFSSTAYAQALGFEIVEFDYMTNYGQDKEVKTVIVITVDGGPRGNPCYQKGCPSFIAEKIERHNRCSWQKYI